jgi:hypothetical protein
MNKINNPPSPKNAHKIDKRLSLKPNLRNVDNIRLETFEMIVTDRGWRRPGFIL